ncbi:MAG: LysE family transporter [Dissulfuribacterales bacterium]
MIEYITAALIFGASGGLSPGPLSVIVIHETLTRGFRAGVMVALSPLFTDVPIMAAASLLFSRTQDTTWLQIVLSVIGGLYLLRLGYKSLRVTRVPMPEAPDLRSGPLLTGIKMNFLNPNPYLFWFTVAGPYLISGTISTNLAFLATFLSVLISIKTAIAFGVSRFRSFLHGRIYDLIMRALALCLLGYGAAFLIKACRLLLQNLHLLSLT